MLSIPLESDRPTVAIETHGCKLNQADSTVLASGFVDGGFRLVTSDQPADVYLVNTCTVTHVADRKGRQALRSARRRNPKAMLVATGCYAQRSPEELKCLAEVDLVAGNDHKFEVIEKIRKIVKWRKNSRNACAEGIDNNHEFSRNRAMVKIQEGCNQICSYCIVPKVRGRERSVTPMEITRLIELYERDGYREVVLTGTQLGSYGFDLPNIDLTGLLEFILAGVKIPRLRMSSVQPQEIGKEMLRLWADSRLCPHFHLALQSGSDEILKRMRRRYTASEYLEAVELIREMVPGVSITTDVIVGFPGETDKNFRETYALCDRVGFASVHVFPYSARPGTSASYFSDHVSPAIKSNRVQELIALSQQHAERFRRQNLGNIRPVLWEGQRPIEGRDVWVGLTDNYLRVVSESPRNLRNKITRAKLIYQQGEVIASELHDTI